MHFFSLDVCLIETLLYCVHWECNRTQTLFLTCTLCSRWSHSKREKKQKKRQESGIKVCVRSPLPCFLFLFYCQTKHRLHQFICLMTVCRCLYVTCWRRFSNSECHLTVLTHYLLFIIVTGRTALYLLVFLYPFHQAQIFFFAPNSPSQASVYCSPAVMLRYS